MFHSNTKSVKSSVESQINTTMKLLIDLFNNFMIQNILLSFKRKKCLLTQQCLTNSVLSILSYFCYVCMHHSLK